MTAVYPLDLFTTHQLWSRILVSAFSGLLFVSFFAFRSAGRSHVPIALAAVVGYVSAVAWLLFGSAHWIELTRSGSRRTVERAGSAARE